MCVTKKKSIYIYVKDNDLEIETMLHKSASLKP